MAKEKKDDNKESSKEMKDELQKEEEVPVKDEKDLPKEVEKGDGAKKSEEKNEATVQEGATSQKEKNEAIAQEGATSQKEKIKATAVAPPPEKNRGIFCCWNHEKARKGQDRETFVKNTVRELSTYICFAIIFLSMTFLRFTQERYRFRKVIADLLLENRFGDFNALKFGDVETVDQFWDYCETVFIDNLYWQQWYNGEEAVGDEASLYHKNYLVGVPRFKQTRVKNDTSACTIQPEFRTRLDTCYPQYTIEDTEPFTPGAEANPAVNTDNAFIHALDKGAGEADIWYVIGNTIGSFVNFHIGGHWSKLGYSYPASGFLQTMSKTKEGTRDIIRDLRRRRWIDRATHAVQIDLTVYNGNLNLFCIVKLVAEFPVWGGVVTSNDIHSFKYKEYHTAHDFMYILPLRVVFLLFVAFYFVEEVLEMRMLKGRYLRSSIWNVVDLLVIVFSVVAVAFYVFKFGSVGAILASLAPKEIPTAVTNATNSTEAAVPVVEAANPLDEFVSYENIAFLSTRWHEVYGIVGFFIVIKVFKFMKFNKTMSQLQVTLKRVLPDCFGFAVMFICVFLGYVIFAYMQFGATVDEFSEPLRCVETLFLLILGDFDFATLRKTDPFAMFAFFVSYEFFVFLVLLNMFLAIIGDTYSEVKREIDAKPDEFEIKDYLRRACGACLRNWRFQQDHLSELEDAINFADANKDHAVDWDEWRNDLLGRGIPNSEIAKIFSKYDKDGNMELNNEETQQLQEDLAEARKEAINREHERIKAELHVKKRGKSGSDDEGDLDGEGDKPEDVNKGFFMELLADPDMEPELEPAVTLEEWDTKYKNFTPMVKKVDRLEIAFRSVIAKLDTVIAQLGLENELPPAPPPKPKKRKDTKKAVSDYALRKDTVAEKVASEGEVPEEAAMEVAPEEEQVDGG